MSEGHNQKVMGIKSVIMKEKMPSEEDILWRLYLDGLTSVYVMAPVNSEEQRLLRDALVIAARRYGFDPVSLVEACASEPLES